MSGLLLFSIGAPAQTVADLPLLLQQAGLPDIVSFDGGTGSIRIAFDQCTSTDLRGENTGAITNLKIILNTNTLAANVTVTSMLGNLSVNLNDIRLESVDGT